MRPMRPTPTPSAPAAPRRLLAPLLALAAATALAALPAPAPAALPAAVDGQPLPSLAPMLERVTPGVVSLNTRSVQRRAISPDEVFMRRFFGLPDLPQARVQQSLGSGVIVDAERGLVLTNHHVIDGADEITVTLHDGRQVAAEFIGSDPDSDLAVLRIEADGLQALPLADTSALRIGDFVVAVGNPFGLGQTATSGMVSALGRTSLRGLSVQNFIQTDASINPGNSGGALVNLRGELVGINTAIFSPSGGNVGIGFAIPTNLAAEVMRQLLAYGEVRRGSLGIEAQDLDADLARALGLQARRGALVTRVYPRSAAAAAGIREGDLITAVNGQAVNDIGALRYQEGLLPVERAVPVTVQREGREQRLNVTLRPRPQELAGADLHRSLSGASFVDLPRRYREQGLRGVIVSEIGADSAAARAGLRPGDRIEAVGRQGIDDLASFEAAVAPNARGLALTVTRGHRRGVLNL